MVWNNFAWAAIRDLQYGLFDGREIGTGFYQGDNRQAYNPDFAGGEGGARPHVTNAGLKGRAA